MSKPGGRPNLSLAGKKETPAQQKQNRGGAANRGAGRGRGCGRGRGGGPRPRQELIQTGGVFSEGLGGDFPSRKKDKDVDAAQFGYAKRPTGAGPSTEGQKAEPKKEEVKMDGKASFEGWDALWATDEEEDDKVLNELHPKGFISDLKRGSLMPVVLPVDDQAQFLSIMNKSARLSLEDTMEVDEKKPGTKEGPTAEELIRMLENSSEELLHIQLPSVVAAICNSVEKAEIPLEIPMEVDEEGEPPKEAPPPPSGLPEKRKIGKLQVTQNGRLILQIGSHSIDITSKPTTGKQQGTVLLEVDPNADQEPGPFSQPSTVENALYHLGNVKHSLVGSMSFGALNENPREESKPRGKPEIKESSKQEKERIEELEREQAKWAGLAARWATGLL